MAGREDHSKKMFLFDAYTKHDPYLGARITHSQTAEVSGHMFWL